MEFNSELKNILKQNKELKNTLLRNQNSNTNNKRKMSMEEYNNKLNN